MVIAVFLAVYAFFSATFDIFKTVGDWIITIRPDDAAACVIMVAFNGLSIYFLTEYCTSYAYKHVCELADSFKTGAATNMIYRIALCYKSVITPLLVLARIIYGSSAICDMYGFSLTEIGFLYNLATGLTIDVYGPVCDNDGGIAERVELCNYVCKNIDALDTAGSTTTTIGKGYAIGSVALVSLAHFSASVKRILTLLGG